MKTSRDITINPYATCTYRGGEHCFSVSLEEEGDGELEMARRRAGIGAINKGRIDKVC